MKTAWFLAAALTLAAAIGQDSATLIGLDPAAVERKIGAPQAKDELADSDEMYWIYRTPEGELSVHFQNRLVIGYTPEDFPLEKILK